VVVERPAPRATRETVRPTGVPRLDKPKKVAPRRKPASERRATAVATQVKAARVARGAAVSLELSEESSELSGTRLLLILSFGASALLLVLAAVPPAWSLRFPGYSARLVDVRDKIAMAGCLLLVESGVIALILTR
jgi:hypothetical protein